ncbi:uncharacterized protein SCODWIG_03724 [Saccharomycodes ludwigii]|uniref:Sodium/bile acid cotransporter 7 n=1 Tax=Saccharomycodes ludwigii TaxID=36035 RepID=A0A376BB99_9ASCO|nr:uncharacterized protein SCODWIG_03724 [Saccharomycodes ludwigii]
MNRFCKSLKRDTIKYFKNFNWTTFFKDLKQYIISQWFFIALAIFIVIARFAPNFARHGGLIRGEYTIGYGAVAVIFLKSGLTIETKRFLINIANWRAHVTVLVISFLITSAIMYGFVLAIYTSKTKVIDEWVLVGLLMTANCPTTVASNVIMTGKANGNDTLAVCEVIIGNILGAFITPALGQMYCRGKLQFANPANGSSVTALYRRVMQQIGSCLFAPIFVGQVIQYFFPQQIKWFFNKFYPLKKIGNVMLLLIMFSSYSTAFYQHAFTSVSHTCIIFVCFFNIGMYFLYTFICLMCARPYPIIFSFPNKSNNVFNRLLRPFYLNKRDSVAVMLCGAAKSAALGVALITSQYGSNSENLGKLLVPLVLFQSEQVLVANFLVPIFRRWIDIDNAKTSSSLDKSSNNTGTEKSCSNPLFSGLGNGNRKKINNSVSENSLSYKNVETDAGNLDIERGVNRNMTTQDTSIGFRDEDVNGGNSGNDDDEEEEEEEEEEFIDEETHEQIGRAHV